MSNEPLSWGRGSTAGVLAGPGASAGGTDLQRWSVPARSADLESIRNALTDSDSLGVVITGARGVGKSSLARTAVADLGPDVWALQLRSPLAGSQTSYGCLAFLLARLPQSAMGSPTAILQGITSLIKSDAGGRECIITLDTTGMIDDMSAGILLNIMLTRTARVIAIAPGTSDLPADFHWLLTDRRLTEVRLENLNELQTRQVLLTLLGHRVSASLVSTYHAIVGGNPLLLKALVTEQQQSGNLVLSDSVWTLRDKVVLDGAAGLDDIVRSRWSRETPESREVMEMLSCARRVPLSRLTELYGTDIVADMEDAGLLKVGDTEERWVSLREQYLGDVVRSWLSISRRRELRSELLGDDEPELAKLSLEERIEFAAWTRECQAELSPTMAVAAAEAAVQMFDPRFALSCVEGLKRTDAEWVAGQHHKATAYLLLDLPLQAMDALDSISQAQLDELGVEDFARVVAAKCRVMMWLPELCDKVPAEIADARRRLDVAPGPAASWPDALGAAANVITLAEFEYRSFIGDYAPMIPVLEEAADPATNKDPGFRIQSALILMHSLSAVGREMDALQLMRRVGGQLSDAGPMTGLREMFAMTAFSVLLQAGQWRRCLDLVGPPKGHEERRLAHRTSAMELATGIAYVYSGRGAVALDSLLSAVAQLELRPVVNMLQAAYAATAFAYAQIGNAGQAHKYLDKLRGARGHCNFRTKVVTDFCADMAGRWLGDPDAVKRLLDAARRDIAAERYTLAGISLLGATVNGTDDDFRLMEQVAGHRQGKLAEISRLIAVGSRTKDAKVLLEGAHLAAELELDAVEARCVALAVDFARHSGDSASARVAQARLDSLTATVPSLPIVPSSGSPLLTARERQISRLAGRGVSNRDIALEIGVSVRTVEGHLYQVFTKLGVTSRGDLPGLV
ncbi:DNA-binding CsgD family transcriptional regulator [Arthrobacter pascens]|uniref:helix-turn-helix transcriptional regulator n=1 Tax=Arthrobacter pascens TaxID=1677 RepID=UPI0028658143|nr:LuxR C-terminal-related transcriptional regulator [Arthrobacter pascens]MDR6557086.1 DNA-binding CsgD family transcriptional regulator [Arthrobacter pascens]